MTLSAILAFIAFGWLMKSAFECETPKLPHERPHINRDD